MRTKVFISTILCISLLMVSTCASSLQIPKTQIVHPSAHIQYAISTVKPVSKTYSHALTSGYNGSGPILWENILPSDYATVSIGNNDTQIFTESILGDYFYGVCFQLYSTQGDGQARWQYYVNNTGYGQIDAAKERDLLVGIASNNILQVEQPPFQRLYKWTSASSTPDWTFDIPASYHVFQGGLAENNLVLSGDGTRVILAATNTTNNLIRLYQFDADTGTLLTTYTLHLTNPNLASVASLDVTRDGSLVFIAYYSGACLINLTTQTILWTNDVPLGGLSGDGSTLVSFADANTMSIIVLEWNATSQLYQERLRQPVLPYGWTLLANAHPVDVSDDGSTIIIGCGGNVTAPPINQTKTILFDSHSGKLWEYTTHSRGFDIIFDVRLSRTGGRAIVASTGDNVSSVDQVRVFDRNNSHPRFSIHTPGSVFTADIAPDGVFAAAAAETSWMHSCDGQSFLYSLNTSGIEPPQDLTTTFHGGRAFTLTIKNDDNATATNVLWTFSITGGICHQISFDSYGLVPTIPGHQTTTTAIEQLKGFGRIAAYVTINHAWYPITGWIIGPFIFLKHQPS